MQQPYLVSAPHIALQQMKEADTVSCESAAISEPCRAVPLVSHHLTGTRAAPSSVKGVKGAFPLGVQPIFIGLLDLRVSSQTVKTPYLSHFQINPEFVT